VAVKGSDGLEYEKLVGPNFEDFVKSSKRKGRHPNNDTQDGITESLRLLLSDDSSNLNTEVVLALFVKLNNQIKSLKREIEILQVELQPNQKKEDIMDIQGAMGFLGLKKSTIYSKVNRKELPYMKIGKRLYFSRNELEGYLKDARFVSDQEIEKKAQNYFKKD
jgi:excisionase family DNA binding protein